MLCAGMVTSSKPRTEGPQILEAAVKKCCLGEAPPSPPTEIFVSHVDVESQCFWFRYVICVSTCSASVFPHVSWSVL